MQNIQPSIIHLRNMQHSVLSKAGKPLPLLMVKQNISAINLFPHNTQAANPFSLF
jgi:hypothetical protein